MAGAPYRGEGPSDLDEHPQHLPTWLLKELERAGVADEAIEALDEDAARDLVAEIRSEAFE